MNMKLPFTIGCLVVAIMASAQVTPREFKRNLRKGLYEQDTSYIYQLPFTLGKKSFMAQGYNGVFSHRGEFSIDFKLKKGAPVLAARGGVVLRTKDDSDKGGISNKYIFDANYVIIRHEDGSEAGYWHLKHKGVAVSEGDTVQAGQVIGYCGSTGYSSGPHLHFWVYMYKDSRLYTVPTRFMTPKGPRYLKAWRCYKAVELVVLSRL